MFLKNFRAFIFAVKVYILIAAIMKVRSKTFCILAVAACIAVPCIHSMTERVPSPQAYEPIVANTLSEERAFVTIDCGGKTFSYRDELIEPSDFTVSEELDSRRVNCPLEQKIEFVDMCLQRGADYETAMTTAFPLLKRTVDAVDKYLYKAPVDAKVVYKNGVFSVSHHKSGVALDRNRLFGGIYYSFKYFGSGKSVEAKTVELLPDVTYEQLKANLVLRGMYTTEYATSSADRAHNVAHAASKFDGISVAAGESVSFNRTVGERTSENGFKTAKIILDGKYVDGVGGGACQASTAVYNAALVAGLNARANAHTICPTYCMPGLDAMISSSSDLIITNTTEHAVFFSVKSYGKKTTVSIYGAPLDFTVVPESVVNATVPFEVDEFVDTEWKYFDKTAVHGDRLMVAPGREGYESSTYVKYYKNGKFVKRVKIRSNVYKPTPRLIAIAQ